MHIVSNDNFLETLTRDLKTTSGTWIVMGPGQSGRTQMCNTAFTRANLECINISTDNGSVKELSKSMEPHRDTLTISSFFSCKPRVLFLDDFDMYGTEKAIQNFVLAFIKHPNFVSSKLRIVMVVTTSHEKHFKDMAKKSIVLRIQNPPIEKALEYVAHLHPDIDREKLEKLCVDMQGNIGGILSRVSFLEQSDTYSVLIKDRTSHDMLHMLFRGKILPVDSDALYTYEPKIMAMLYFDNMNRYILNYPNGVESRRRLASILADMHILEEKAYGTCHSGVVNDIWCQLLCSQPAVTDSETQDMSYDHTKILSRTANRCNLNKRMYRVLHQLGVDQNCREVVFDVLSDTVVSCGGKKGMDDDTYALCREYLSTVGEIKKEYLDKYMK